jgi:hypothetical protein
VFSFIGWSPIEGCIRASPRSQASEFEHRPTYLVSQTLIVQDKFVDRIRELFTLPTALEPAGTLTLKSGSSRTNCLDRISRSTKLMGGDMRHRCGLAGSICGVPRSSAQHSCRSLGMTSRIARLRHFDLSAYPCSCLLDRLARPQVQGFLRLEKVKNMFSTRGCPQSQKTMVSVREGPSTADGDEAGIADFREDHGYTFVIDASRSGLTRTLN